MLPTLQNKNILLVEKISPKLGKLKQGDIVTLYVPEIVGTQKKRIIKRVAAVENDVIEIKDGKVYINNKLLNEDYINGNSTLPINSRFSKVSVPKGCIYVLGDNRFPNESRDSRDFGPLSISKVEGKVLLRLLPLNEIGALKR